jgi:hypothetical protein
MNMVPYASAVGSLMNAQVWYYPNVVHVSGLFWQKSSLDIDHWNGVKMSASCEERKNKYSQIVVGTNIKFWRDV